MEEAEALCDQLAIINHGKIISQDSTKNLKQLFGYRDLQISFAEDIKDIKFTLPKLEYSKIDNHQIKIRYKTGIIEIAEILKLIAQLKLTITDLTTCESDLEEIFKMLIKKQNAA